MNVEDIFSLLGILNIFIFTLVSCSGMLDGNAHGIHNKDENPFAGVLIGLFTECIFIAPNFFDYQNRNTLYCTATRIDCIFNLVTENCQKR